MVDVHEARLAPPVVAGQSEDLLQPALFNSAADALRGWAEGIVAQRLGPAEDVERLLVTFISWLDTCARHLTGDKWSSQFGWMQTGRRGGHFNTLCNERGQFGHQFLANS